MKGKTAQIKAHLTGDGYRTELSNARHTIVADGSPTGEGFNPGEILASALGSCMSMTTIGFARMNKIPLDAIEIGVKLSDGKTTGVAAHFDVDVKLFGDLSPEQHTEILSFTKKCHIHEILKGVTTLDVNQVM
jgi:uncharacterized OsmC-like protein